MKHIKPCKAIFVLLSKELAIYGKKVERLESLDEFKREIEYNVCPQNKPLSAAIRKRFSSPERQISWHGLCIVRPEPSSGSPNISSEN